jgi:hypothetical protein
MAIAKRSSIYNGPGITGTNPRRSSRHGAADDAHRFGVQEVGMDTPNSNPDYVPPVGSSDAADELSHWRNPHLEQSQAVDRMGNRLDLKHSATFQIFEVHRHDLEYTGTHILSVARRRAQLASLGKVLVILLGAFVATKEVANQVLGGASAVNTVIYAVAGLMIAAVTGLEAAFKWENTASELRHLVAMSWSTARKAASDVTGISAKASDDEKLFTLRKILENIDITLADVQTKAANLGVDMISPRNPR